MTAVAKKKERKLGAWAPRQPSGTLGFQAEARAQHQPAAAPVAPPKAAPGSSYTVTSQARAPEDVAPPPHNRSFNLKRPKTLEEAKALIDRMSNSGERFAEVDS